MATPKKPTSTANQRESRVSTPAPKIPAVIAKPTAPTQTLNVYGSPATNARPATKTVTTKISGSTKTAKSTCYAGKH